MQRAILQDRFRRERLQQRAGNNPAVRNAETVTELKSGAADDHLLVPESGQRGWVATQHIDVGQRRNGGGADAEIDQEGSILFAILASQYRAHGRKKLPASFAEWVATDQSVRLDCDIHDR